MKLTDLDSKKVATKALKENFAFNFDPSKMATSDARKMLTRVKGIVNEAKRSPEFHSAQRNPEYLKLMFMEQALSEHLALAARNRARIIFENEEVEKSQVILAAQDMVDTVQKMYENVNDMLVKELPALVDSIQSQIGVNESTQYSQAANESLGQLNTTLQETRTALQTALGALTGQVDADAFGPEVEESDIDDETYDMGDEDMELDVPEVDDEYELPAEEDDFTDIDLTSVGRAKR